MVDQEKEISRRRRLYNLYTLSHVIRKEKEGYWVHQTLLTVTKWLMEYIFKDIQTFFFFSIR